MKKSFLLSILIFLISSLFANDTLSVTPKLSILQRLQYQGLGGAASANDISDYESPFYSRTALRGDIEIKKDFFCFSPYIAERLEFFASSGSFDDVVKKLNIDLRLRNRVYLGLLSTFSLGDFLKLSIDIENILTNDFKKVSTTDILTAYKLSTTVALKGSHNDFGVSYLLSLLAGFSVDGNSTRNKEAPIGAVYIEGRGRLEYEFLHFFVEAASPHKLGVYGDYFFSYTNSTLYDNLNDANLDGDLGVGIKYSYNSISPKVGLQFWHDFNDYYANSRNSLGFLLGLALAKNNLSFSLNFIGGKELANSEAKFQSCINGIFAITF